MRAGASLLSIGLLLAACGDDDGSGGNAIGGGEDAFSEELCDVLTEADFEPIGMLDDVEVRVDEVSAACTYSISSGGSVLLNFFGGILADHSVYEDFIASGDYEAIEGLGADVAQFTTGSYVAFTDSMRLEFTAFLTGDDEREERRLFELALSRLLERD